MNQLLTVDRTRTIETLKALVRINSINPSLVPGAPGEREIAAYLADRLDAIDLEVTVSEVAPGRFNVIGRLPGRGNGPTLLLNAHTDTVGVEGMDEPFTAALRDGKLYGRGAQDMKGSLAAMLAAVRAVVEAGIDLDGDILFTAVADEEHASIGTEHLVGQFQADAAIVTEPTDLAICRAHRGFIWYRVETEGRAAHGSRYREGVDAISHMGRFLTEMDLLGQELVNRAPLPLMGAPSLHASLIEGGTELSVYPARCQLQLERRTVSGETETECTAELQAIVDRLAAADDTFKATVAPFFERRPFTVSAEARIVQLVEDAAAQHLQHPPAHVGQTFWTDAALLAGAGIETVVIGPTGGGLHSAEEWVEVQSVLDLAHILAQTIVAYCGAS